MMISVGSITGTCWIVDVCVFVVVVVFGCVLGCCCRGCCFWYALRCQGYLCCCFRCCLISLGCFVFCYCSRSGSGCWGTHGSVYRFLTCQSRRVGVNGWFYRWRRMQVDCPILLLMLDAELEWRNLPDLELLIVSPSRRYSGAQCDCAIQSSALLTGHSMSYCTTFISNFNLK